MLEGWPVNWLWVLGVAASFIVAVIDAALGNRAILIGLLIVGPCCVVLTGRWVPTANRVWVTGLAVALGFPDGIWNTAIFFIWLAAVAVVALACAGPATWPIWPSPSQFVAQAARERSHEPQHRLHDLGPDPVGLDGGRDGVAVVMAH